MSGLPLALAVTRAAAYELHQKLGHGNYGKESSSHASKARGGLWGCVGCARVPRVRPAALRGTTRPLQRPLP